MPQFFAPGKLLLSGEYLILNGARGLVAPTKIGQHLVVETLAEKKIVWQAEDHLGATWIEAHFDERLRYLGGAKNEQVVFLEKLLALLFPGGLEQGYALQFKIDFNRDWGLGSSSTLIALLAQWRGLDAMDLFFASLTGSGYDVAVGMEQCPLLYRLENGQPSWEKVSLPAFLGDTYLVYLNQKQRSDREVKRFKNRKVSPENLATVDRLSEELLRLEGLDAWDEWCAAHEKVTAQSIGLETIKSKFPAFKGGIKSLGAWGGDFAWFSRTENIPYLQEQGYDTIIPFRQLIEG